MKRLLTFALLLSLLVVLFLFKTTGTRAASPQSCGGWRVIPSPNQGQGIHRNYLYSVSADSSNDAWALGNYEQNKSQLRPLVEHWNGSQWSIVQTPAHPGLWLNAVTALAPNDVWIVGYYFQHEPIFEHWNGSQWSLVHSPNVSSAIASTLSFTVVASNDIWAAGSYETQAGTYQTLFEHWNGTRWSIVPGAAIPGTSNLITGIQAISSNDVVALASYTSGNNVYYNLLEQWNGSQWNEVSGSQIPTTSYQDVTSMTAIADNDIWVAGGTAPPTGQWTTLIEQWNGSSWSVVPSPNAGTGPNTLQSIVALAANNIWTVGYFGTKRGTQTLTERWDGTQWKIIPSLNVGGENDLNQVVQVAGTNDLWAVGTSSPRINSLAQTLTEFYC